MLRPKTHSNDHSLYDSCYLLMVILSAETQSHLCSPSNPVSGLTISATGPSNTLSLFNYHLEQHENFHFCVYSPFNFIHCIDILIKQMIIC